MKKEIVRVGLKKTKNYQSFEATIECEILYTNLEDRAGLVKELYARCRADIKAQMELDNGKKPSSPIKQKFTGVKGLNEPI